MSQEEKKEVVKVEPRQVQLSRSQQFVNEIVLKLEKGNKEIGEQFTDYGKRCVVNAINGLLTLCRSNGINTNEIDPMTLQLQLQNIGFTELNYATNPAEVYFDLRKVYVENKNGDKELRYSITIKPQGVGNEKLVRLFGLNIKELYPAWLVRKGDEFTYPMYEGNKITPPTWKIKGTSGKVILVVYVVKKNNGEFEYLMADRDSVKQNLIAQIRQNTIEDFKVEKTNSKGAKYKVTDKDARDKFYAKVDADFEGKTLDECLKMEEYRQYINPTYTSGGSMESMIIRKMKNNALKNYPKEYDRTVVAESAADMWEDKDTTLDEKPQIKKDVVDIIEAQIEESGNDEAPKDFVVDEDGVIEEKEETVVETKEEPTVEPEEKETDPNPEDMF